MLGQGLLGLTSLRGPRTDNAPTQQPALLPVLKLDRDKRTGGCYQLKETGPAPTPPPPLPARPAELQNSLGVTAPDLVSPLAPGRQRAEARGGWGRRRPVCSSNVAGGVGVPTREDPCSDQHPGVQGGKENGGSITTPRSTQDHPPEGNRTTPR